MCHHSRKHTITGTMLQNVLMMLLRSKILTFHLESLREKKLLLRRIQHVQKKNHQLGKMSSMLLLETMDILKYCRAKVTKRSS